MRTLIRLTAPLLISLFFLTWGGSASAQNAGGYITVGPIPAQNSLDSVVFEEFLNFTCPHCNNFRAAAAPLLRKYGNRVKHENVPIVFRGQNDEVVRLFYIAKEAGQEDTVKDAIFDAVFKYGANIQDPAVVNYVATSVGLGEKYRAERGADWVTKQVEDAQARSRAYGVRATPTVVLQNSMLLTPRTGMQAFVGNLDQLIESLLKKQS